MLLAAFVSHEARTQLRSTRFRVLAVAYVIIALVPAVALYLASANLGYALGAGAYAMALQALVPSLTALFATVMAVDAITREREEGSFGVISLAPMSATGFVFRRWIAVLTLALPLTTVPYAIAAALAGHAERRVPDLAPLAWEWLLHTVPPLVILSALMLALGTITGRTILAIVAFGAAMSFGLGFLQDALSWWHRRLDGPGEMIGFDPLLLSRLVWTMRGWWQFDPPSAAGYPIEFELDRLLPESALIAGMAALFLGLAPAFLRRTRRDVRPWRIREDHQLRTMLRGINRIREEYHPDAGLQLVDRIVMGLGVLVAIACIGLLLRRETRFIRLAGERYAAEESKEPREMSVALAPQVIAVDGVVDREIRTRTVFDLTNRGREAQGHLAFALHPGLRIERVTATCGGTRVTRRWERVGIDLERPLAPGAPCRLTVEVSGAADSPLFNLQGRSRFGARYRRWRDATETIDLSDLSRSTFLTAVNGQRMALTASDFAPVPRYTPWIVNTASFDRDRDTQSFVAEGVLPVSEVRVSLQVPDGFTALDSCGTLSTRRLAGRCAFAFSEFRIHGARLRTMPLPGATLVHLPAHGELARLHAPAFAEALAAAERAWPDLGIAGTPVFLEKPIEDDGERASWWNPGANVIDASGPVFFIPEWLFIKRKPMAVPQIASSIVASTLRGRRAVPPEERRFFDVFFAEVARARTGSGENRRAVMGGRGPRPSTDPLLRLGWGMHETVRLRGILVDLESRVGAGRLVEGINEFVSRPGRGTAKELLDVFARRAGVDLDPFYRDYFEGTALPKLTLEDVAFGREGNRWVVRGFAHNLATGEVLCPVVLRTKFGSVRETVRIGTGERVPFVLSSEFEPRTLQLDPDGVVYRHAAIGTVDSIDYKGQS